MKLFFSISAFFSMSLLPHLFFLKSIIQSNIIVHGLTGAFFSSILQAMSEALIATVLSHSHWGGWPTYALARIIICFLLVTRFLVFWERKSSLPLILIPVVGRPLD